MDDANRTFVTSVRPAPVTESTGDASAFELPFDTFTWNEVAGIFLIIVGGMIVVYRRELRTLAYESGRIAIGAGAVFMIAGGILAFGVDTHTDAVDPSAGNPIPSTPESIEQGRMLYQQNCVVCHGEDGRGDGPGAEGLDPAPSDFRLHVPVHDDPQFFAFIANGYPGSAMPAWRDRLTEEEIWHLVNFITEEFNEAPTARR
jgi:mono/diheme cytochrome c family protein